MPNAAPAPRRTEMPQIDALTSVECPSCAAAYRLPAAQAAKGWLRCSACRHVWEHDDAEADMAGDGPAERDDASQDMDEAPAAAPSVEEPGLDGPADASDEAMTADEIDALLAEGEADVPAEKGADILVDTAPHDGPQEPEGAMEDAASAGFSDDAASTASALAASASAESASAESALAPTPADPTDDADATDDEPAPVPLPEDDPAAETSTESSAENSAENMVEAADPADVEADTLTSDGSPIVEDDREAASLDEAAPDAEAAESSAPHRRIAPLAARVAAGAVLLAGTGAAISGISAREAVVRALPRTAILFEALGTPVNLTPYDLAASDARLATQGDRDHLSMTVSVRNTGEEPRPLPALDLVLRDADGRAIERSALRVPTELLRGLDTISFKAQVDLGGETDARRVVDAVVALSPPAVQRAALARIQPIGPER